ncbi:MAG: sel1 repeat family protein [Akkermansia sp.]|nr:sel1 repeat family protein [Akkermansia sp.]
MKRVRTACALLCGILLTGCHNNALLRELADEGHAPAQYELGRRILTGTKGMPETPAAAVPWFRLAADGGDHRAMAALALCFERGLGVNASADAARDWYRRAAENGNPNACLALVQMETRAGNLPGAVRWLQPIAEGNSVEAQLLCAKLCLSGHGGADGAQKAVRYLRFAAMQGNAEACLLMSSCYAAGVGVPKNEALMLGWLANAAVAGDEKAQRLMEMASEDENGNFSEN